MSTALETVLFATVTLAVVTYVAFWLGVRHEAKRTRAWAQRAITSTRIAGILAEANRDLKSDLTALQSGRPLTDREARAFERIVKDGDL